MAKVVVSLKIMPESPDINLEDVQEKVLDEIKSFAGDVETKVEVEPVAFGLKSLNVKFVLDESKGSTEPLEDKIKDLPGVQSVEVTDVRRIVG